MSCYLLVGDCENGKYGYAEHMEYSFLYPFCLAICSMLAVPPSASRILRRARIIIAYAMLHPIHAALLLGCKAYIENDCGIDMTWRLGGGWLLWGWIFALPILGGLEVFWRLINHKQTYSLKTGCGDDTLADFIACKAAPFLLVPVGISIGLILLD